MSFLDKPEDNWIYGQQKFSNFSMGERWSWWWLDDKYKAPRKGTEITTDKATMNKLDKNMIKKLKTIFPITV